MKRESQREKRGNERVIKEMGRDRMNEGGVWECWKGSIEERLQMMAEIEFVVGMQLTVLCELTSH
jgi:hypothetical protein